MGLAWPNRRAGVPWNSLGWTLLRRGSLSQSFGAKACSKRRDLRKRLAIKWHFVDLAGVAGRVLIAPDPVGAEWFLALIANRVKCLLCGEQCGNTGKHAAALYSWPDHTSGEDGRALLVTMCAGCLSNFASFAAAAQAVDAAMLSRGRSLEPLSPNYRRCSSPCRSSLPSQTAAGFADGGSQMISKTRG